MPYRVNGEIISLADSAADRADTGYDFEIEGSATAALMLTEADQVDPAGRYRLIVTGDLLLIQRAASGAWATAETLHTFNTVVQSVGDDIVFGFGLPDVRISWDTTDANANELLIQLPAGTAVNVPVIIIGQAIESVDPGLYNGVVDPRIAMFGVGAVTTGPVFEFRKARGSFTSPTVVTSGDDLGTIRAFGAVAAAEWVQAAEIRFDMAGTIATTRGPGTITFLTATDAAPSVLTVAMTIGADQFVSFALGATFNDDALLGIGTGNTARLSWDTTDANANELLLQLPAGGGTDVPVIVVGVAIESVDLGLYNGVVDPRLAFLAAGAVTTGSVIEFRKARGSVTSPTVVTSGDDLGTLDFYGAVAAGEYVRAASIRVDMAGTIGTTRGPGTITFLTATDAAPSVMTQAMIISAAQVVTLTAGVTTGNHTFSLTVTAGADGVGSAGEQFQSGGAAAECVWAAAASQRETKDVLAEVSDQAAAVLEKLIKLPVYDFRYNREVNKGTGDFDTVYRGIMADEAPEFMHHNGTILNPISPVGNLLLGLKALVQRVEALEQAA